MARLEMAELVARLRRMVGDTSVADEAFTDEELCEALDARATSVRYLELVPQVTYSALGRAYLTHSAGVGNWDSAETLCDSSYNALTPTSADRTKGRWTFAESVDRVYLTGNTYDLYGASADVLEAWAAKLSREYDFSSDSQDFKRSQQAKTLLALAERYRGMELAKVASQVRDDAN